MAEHKEKHDWHRPNEEMHGKQTSCPKCELKMWMARCTKAEAERDALRKRIETAPVVTFERTPTGASWAHAAQTLADIGKKRVRLVVEE